MTPRLPCRRAQETLFQIRQIRYQIVRSASTSNAPATSKEPVAPRRRKENKPNYKTYGSKIWVYTHLQRNYLIYSLTRSMRNNASLRQIPYNGKKTVPESLRKDLWHPFCNITIEAASEAESNASNIGLSVYQKLREFRRRHELEWQQTDYMDEKGKNFLSKRQIGLRLCDQKANSVADMAYVFSRLGLGGAPREVTEEEKKEAQLNKVGKHTGYGDSIGLIGSGTGTGVQIEWWDLRDAEFAEAWSENVTHTQMVESLKTNNREPNKPWGRGKYAFEEQAAAELAQVNKTSTVTEARTV